MNNNRKIKTLLLAAALGLGTAGMTGMPVDASTQCLPQNGNNCNTCVIEKNGFKYFNADTALEFNEEGTATFQANNNLEFKIREGKYEPTYPHKLTKVEFGFPNNNIVDKVNVGELTKDNKISTIKVDYTSKEVNGTGVIKGIATYEYTYPERGIDGKWKDVTSTKTVEICLNVKVQNTNVDVEEQIVNGPISILQDQVKNKWEQSDFSVNIPVKIEGLNDKQKTKLVDQFQDDFLENIKLTGPEVEGKDILDNHIYFGDMADFYNNAKVELVEGEDGAYLKVDFYGLTIKNIDEKGIDVHANYTFTKVNAETEDNDVLKTETPANVIINEKTPKIEYIDYDEMNNEYRDYKAYVGETRQQRAYAEVPLLEELEINNIDGKLDELIKQLKTEVINSLEMVGYDYRNGGIVENHHIGFEAKLLEDDKTIDENAPEGEMDKLPNGYFFFEANYKVNKYADHIKDFAIGSKAIDWRGVFAKDTELKEYNLGYGVAFDIYKQEVVTNPKVTINLKNGKAATKNIEAGIHFGMDLDQENLDIIVKDKKVAEIKEVQPNKRMANTDTKFFEVKGLKKGTTEVTFKLKSNHLELKEEIATKQSNEQPIINTYEKTITVVVNDTVTTPAKPENKCAVIKKNAQGKVTYVKQCYRNGNVERETFYFFKKDGKTLVKTINKEFAFKTNKRLVKQTVYENYKGGKWTKRTITHKHDNKANRTYSTRVLNKHDNGRTKNLTYKIFHKNGKLRQHKYDAYNNKGQKTKHFNKQYFATGVLRHDYQYSNFVKGKHTKRVFRRFNERKVILSKEVATFKNGKFTKKTTYRYNKKGQLKGGKNLRAWRTITTYRKGKAHRTLRHDYTRSGKLVRS